MDREYEEGRIHKLARSLRRANVPEEAVREILAGGEQIGKTTPPRRKADWMRQAMLKMDALLAPEVRQSVREGCACCLGGKRLELAKRIARENDTFEARIAAANGAKLIFGHSVTLQDDGGILVRFAEDSAPDHRCPCLPVFGEPLPITYCQCCGGHVKHHLQIALGHRLACTVLSSVLSSGATRSCSFHFQITG